MEITKQTAKKIYSEVPEWFREQLNEAFGQECFKEKTYESIKTFEDACNKLNIDPKSVINKNDTVDEIAYKKLKIIIKAINDGWIPNWKDNDERKWWPWFVLSSGFGFSDSVYSYTHSNADVGSRLCFESEEKSDYAANTFIDLYKDFLTINK